MHGRMLGNMKFSFRVEQDIQSLVQDHGIQARSLGGGRRGAPPPRECLRALRQCHKHIWPRLRNISRPFNTQSGYGLMGYFKIWSTTHAAWPTGESIVKCDFVFFKLLCVESNSEQKTTNIRIPVYSICVNERVTFSEHSVRIDIFHKWRLLHF